MVPNPLPVMVTSVPVPAGAVDGETLDMTGVEPAARGAGPEEAGSAAGMPDDMSRRKRSNSSTGMPRPFVVPSITTRPFWTWSIPWHPPAKVVPHRGFCMRKKYASVPGTRTGWSSTHWVRPSTVPPGTVTGIVPENRCVVDWSTRTRAVVTIPVWSAFHALSVPTTVPRTISSDRCAREERSCFTIRPSTPAREREITAMQRKSTTDRVQEAVGLASSRIQFMPALLPPPHAVGGGLSIRPIDDNHCGGAVRTPPLERRGRSRAEPRPLDLA